MFTGVRFVMSYADDNLGIGIVHFERFADIHKDGSPGCYGRHAVIYQVDGPFTQGGHHRQSFKTMPFILKGSCTTRRIGDSAQRTDFAQCLIERTVHTFLEQTCLTARPDRLRPINTGTNLQGGSHRRCTVVESPGIYRQRAFGWQFPHIVIHGIYIALL